MKRVQIVFLIASAAVVVGLTAVLHLRLHDNTPERRAISHLSALSTVVDSYRARFGRLPSEHAGLATIVKASQSNEDAARKLLIDPWGSPIVYRLAPGGGANIYSIGANKIDEHGLGDDIRMP